MRIGILTDHTSINSEYRSFPMLELVRLGHQVGLAPTREDLDFERMAQLDVLHVYRYRDEPMFRLARDLRARGVAIVWDSDDDHTQGANGMPVGQKKGAMTAQRSLHEIQRMLGVAHVVTAASEHLADLYRSWGGEDVEVLENYLPPNYGSPQRERSANEVVVGWPAASEHRYDARHFDLRGMFGRLLDAYEQLRVVTIGIDLDIYHERYRRERVVQYKELGSHLARFDVGIAPIADIPFNHARSKVKVKEYAGAGVPWLASPIGPYADLGEKQGGRLVPDDGWHDALGRLIESPKDRAKLAKKGGKWARSQTVLANLRLLERPLARAVAKAKEPRPT